MQAWSCSWLCSCFPPALRATSTSPFASDTSMTPPWPWLWCPPSEEQNRSKHKGDGSLKTPKHLWFLTLFHKVCLHKGKRRQLVALHFIWTLLCLKGSQIVTVYFAVYNRTWPILDYLGRYRYQGVKYIRYWYINWRCEIRGGKQNEGSVFLSSTINFNDTIQTLYIQIIYLYRPSSADQNWLTFSL